MINLNDYDHCSEQSHTCEENRKRFEIIASREERQFILRFKVDGCVYTDSDEQIKRCDYIFEYKDIFSCFVELKGTDIKHAIEQLISSLQNITVSGKKKFAFIVSAAVPKTTTQKQKFERIFKQKYTAGFDIKTSKMEKNIIDLM